MLDIDTEFVNRLKSGATLLIDNNTVPGHKSSGSKYIGVPNLLIYFSLLFSCMKDCSPVHQRRLNSMPIQGSARKPSYKKISVRLLVFLCV